MVTKLKNSGFRGVHRINMHCSPGITFIIYFAIVQRQNVESINLKSYRAPHVTRRTPIVRIIKYGT